MTRRRSLRGALHNYLGTLTSRYSDFDGYWILGLIVGDLGETTTIDLLSDSGLDIEPTPLAAFTRLAREKFREQIARQRIPVSFVRSAAVEIAKPATRTERYVNGHVTAGYGVTFSARAESDLHTIYVSRASVFVAPHDAAIERRSTRRAPLAFQGQRSGS
jgi:hypothetical protein